jgi:hypothetical protein
VKVGRGSRIKIKQDRARSTRLGGKNIISGTKMTGERAEAGLLSRYVRPRLEID